MRLPPAVTVHGLDHVRIALAPGLPVTLLSAPGAGRFAGALWWQALLEAGRHAGDAGADADLLDCADAASHALEAIRIGLRGIVLYPAAPGWERVAAIAARDGVRLLPERPSSLDLAQPGAARKVGAWLAG